MKAAKSALEQAAIPAEDIDLLIVSTISSNVVLPCTACEVQKEIGAVHAAAYDLNAACTGFVLAYQSAQSFLQAGFYRTVLIIGSECLSNLVNWQDRGTCILFGDGAGAAVLRAESGNGYLPAAHSDGKKGVALKCKSLFDGDMENQRFRQEEYKMQMDGQEVFKFAVRVGRHRLDDFTSGKQQDRRGSQQTSEGTSGKISHEYAGIRQYFISQHPDIAG